MLSSAGNGNGANSVQVYDSLSSLFPVAEAVSGLVYSSVVCSVLVRQELLLV